LAGVLLLLCGGLHAQESTLDAEYQRRLQAGQAIDPQGATPFGEQVNGYTGELTFSQTDVVSAGIGPTIELVRDLRSFHSGDGTVRPAAFGDWLLSVPRIQTLTDAPSGTGAITAPGMQWAIAPANDPDRLARCTRFDRPHYSGWLSDPQAGWNGMALYTQDGVQQSILKRSAQNTRQPDIAEASVFPAVTQGNWQIGCLAQTSNGQQGEAFLAVSPDGTKYWFDYLVGERARTIREHDEFGTWLKQPRMLARMLVSRIQDRFGNWIKYHYCNDVPAGCDGRLTSIDASDGRVVSIAWRSDAPVIDSITVQPGTTPARTWQYQYTDLSSTTAVLSAVVLPDGSRWTFTLSNLGGVALYDPNLHQCSTRALTPAGGSYTSIVTAPSGLVGTFTVSPIWHARSYVETGCLYAVDGTRYEAIPPLFGNYALTQKAFSGPGLANQAWTYAYAPAVGSAARDSCGLAGTCADTTWVDITDPEGNRTRSTYSNRWGPTEGKLLKVQTYQGGSTLLRTQTLAYAAFDHGPWPASVGTSLMDWRSNNAKQETWTPLVSRSTVQQGVTFSHTVAANGLDAFAREIDATDANTQSHSRRVQTSWHDNEDAWVLGQVASRTIAGLQAERTEFDGDDRPWKRYAFGKLRQTLAYYADGMLHTSTDGNGHATTYSDWYRGIPRQVDYADGTAESASVNAYGWITGVADENGYATGYGYDAMGRIASIAYPGDDTVTWDPTTIAFASIGSAEYGIAAGHWRQTVSTGAARKVTYFDALWRPLLTREYDADDLAATERFTRMAYDGNGQVAFAAYPAKSSSATTGVWSDYDALGRPTAVSQDRGSTPFPRTV
jgi:YD repeat-containing protein